MATGAGGTPTRMRAWRTHAYGPPVDALRLDLVDVPEPGAGEVRIRVHAFALNLNDLERISGGNMMVEPELPYSPGMEVMGTVDACGHGADGWLGRRVVATTAGANGGYAEYAVCTAASTFEMPDSVELPDAAALYFPFHLAWIGLFDRAGLEADETVLVHAGAGGSGSAAIQLAVNRGARVFATAGGEAKVERCRQLGAEVVVDYTSEDFAEVVLAETDGRGVDVVFDNVGAAVWEGSIRCTAYNGRYLMMGFASDKSVADEPFVVPRQVMMGNFRLCGVLFAYADDALADLVKSTMGWNFATRELGERIQHEIVELVEQGAVRAVVGDVVAFDEVPAAITAMAERRTTGRTVVMVDSDEWKSIAGPPF